MKTEETLFLPPSGSLKKARQKQKKAEGNVTKAEEKPTTGTIPADCSSQDLFKAVVCSVCNSEVGVYDSEDIYHFFNVLSSYT